MNIIRFVFGNKPHYGILISRRIHAISGDFSSEFSAGEELCSLSEAKLLAPVHPRTVACVAANYYTLLEEMDRAIPPEPEVFLKPPSTVIGNYDEIVYPEISKDVSCGGELAVVIKREARRISKDEALDYVLGYTCALDVTAFDLLADRFTTRGKGYYTFCPLGPWITTDLDGDNLNLKLRVNGELLFDHSTSGMIFSVRQAISYISQFMALEPFDVVLMGSPRPESSISPGDQVEVEIENIGILKNRVVKSNKAEV